MKPTQRGGIEKEHIDHVLARASIHFATYTSSIDPLATFSIAGMEAAGGARRSMKLASKGCSPVGAGRRVVIGG
jgi:hypothetical protein